MVGKKQKIAGVTGALFLGFSLFMAGVGWNDNIPKPGSGHWPPTKIIQAIIATIWFIVPPIWFWYEWFYDQLKNHMKGTPLPDDFELFKYGQDLSAKVWIGVTTALLALYFGKDFGR